MPIYLFENPKTKEVIEVVQRMNEEHIYIVKGVKWNRVFTKPSASIDTQIDPNSSRDFIEKTKNKNYSIGALWDKSAELSEKRAKVDGIDPIKEKEIKKYEDKTKKKHPSKIKKDITI